jgi:predicted secreted protein
MDIALQTQVGAQVEFSLPAYATAGYRWHVVDTPPGVKVAEQPSRPAADAPGGATEQVFKVSPEQVGEFEIELALRRPWEDRATERARVRVTAR